MIIYLVASINAKPSSIFNMSSHIVVNFIYILSLCLNFYKAGPMINNPYNIFPWSPEVNHARSNSFWLIYHIITSFMLSSESRLWHLSHIKRSKNINEKFLVMKIFHLLFVIGVVVNIFNLGNASGWPAFAINSIALATLTTALYLSKSFIYFLILHTPVYLELVKLVFYIYTTCNTL